MPFTIPSKLLISRKLASFESYKHPLTNAMESEAIECGYLQEYFNENPSTSEQLIISNESCWGPIKVAKIMPKSLIIGLPFQWQDGTPVMIELTINEAAVLCKGTLVENVQVRAIKVENHRIVLVPETAFSCKEFLALKASADSLTKSMLTPMDHGKMYQLKRNSKVEYRIYCREGDNSKWIGPTTADFEWENGLIEETTLQMNPVAFAMLQNIKQSRPYCINSTVAFVSYATFMEHFTLFHTPELDIAFKIHNQFDIWLQPKNGILSACFKQSPIVRVSDKLISTIEKRIKISPSDGWMLKLEFTKKRNNYVLKVVIDNYSGKVYSFSPTSYKSLAHLHQEVLRWCEDNSIGVFVGKIKGGLVPACYHNGGWV